MESQADQSLFKVITCHAPAEIEKGFDFVGSYISSIGEYVDHAILTHEEQAVGTIGRRGEDKREFKRELWKSGSEFVLQGGVGDPIRHEVSTATNLLGGGSAVLAGTVFGNSSAVTPRAKERIKRMVFP